MTEHPGKLPPPKTPQIIYERGLGGGQVDDAPQRSYTAVPISPALKRAYKELERAAGDFIILGEERVYSYTIQSDEASDLHQAIQRALDRIKELRG